MSVSSSEPMPLSGDETSFNRDVADRFRQAADLLETQGADGFRVRAYRRAASETESMTQSLADVYRQHGLPGLIALPTIGRSLAVAIADLAEANETPFETFLPEGIKEMPGLVTRMGRGAVHAADDPVRRSVLAPFDPAV